MSGLIQALKTLCVTNLEGSTVEKVYLGIDTQREQVLLDDFPYLIIDDGGEDTIDTVVGGMHVKQYNVIFELGIRDLDEEDALIDALERWETLEELIFHPDNRRLDESGMMVCESLQGFPAVETGFRIMGSKEARGFKWRRAVVPYRLGICRGGHHPWGP